MKRGPRATKQGPTAEGGTLWLLKFPGSLYRDGAGYWVIVGPGDAPMQILTGALRKPVTAAVATRVEPLARAAIEAAASAKTITLKRKGPP